MASEEPVRMLETEPTSFELTEIDAPEEELLGSFLPIGDVAKLIGVNPSVLRFWEQEFPQLRPTKRGNRRYYSSEDVSLIRTIQHLLYEEHYTILGARNKIHELQVQDKAREILDEKKSEPMPAVVKKEEPKIDMTPILQELRAIRALLVADVDVKAREAAREAHKKAQLEACENFSLVSEDLNAILAQEELMREDEAAQTKGEETNEMTAPHSYDLGALGVESDDFLQPSPKIGTMRPKVTVVEPVAVKAEEVPLEKASVETLAQVPATNLEKPSEAQTAPEPIPAPQEQAEPQTKVDTSKLAVPPLPGQQQQFTIGMKVRRVNPQTLTHIAPVVWSKK